MSRTFKDQKKNKIKRQFQKEPQLKKRFSEVKAHGFKEDFDLGMCPDCGGVCEYRQGYFICTECGWGEYSGKWSDIFKGEVFFAEAA